MAVTARLAAGAPVPVLAVVGAGARDAVHDLSVWPEIELVATPRAATVLLAAGRIPAALAERARRVHDQLPHPRAAVRWAVGADGALLPGAVAVAGDGGDAARTVVDVHRRLMRGDRASAAPLLPTEPPTPWRGVGPHGQGGEGMMGGRPYGRPMAMTGDDRDGLALDQLTVELGPFLPGFPPGLALSVTLQGDVVQEVEVAPNPFAGDRPGAALDAEARPFVRLQAQPVAVADVELARARSHLRWAADALRCHGLDAFAVRVVRAAAHLQAGDADGVAALARRLRRNPTLRWAMAGVGTIDPAHLPPGASGPVVRAAGIARDARNHHPAYRSLGFEPVVHDGGDAWARFEQRLAETEQALALAGSGGRTRIGPGEPVETPRGRPDGRDAGGWLLSLLPALIAGSEWGQALTTIVSLDLDLEHAAAPDAASVGA